ncbi:hypothetical protein [Kutzneria albida]|uniref:Uncharacterized protein n=1 Tax=Kutzneria albida DSM 43870 TaxID=1449976 RepID=W5WCK6_9PSEU|nr:hypothetical protein [Kutzneria albida]AHH98271.1 hypothetical protein KALB_4909 [Kutzneria albida DSM 43870]
MTSKAAKFAALAAALYAVHQVADHLTGQTDPQAAHKCDPGPDGTRACLGHVLQYTAHTAGAVLVLNKALRLGITPAGFVVGQAVSAVTHYWADRDRGRLARLSAKLGSPVFPSLGKPRENIRAYVKTSGGEELPVHVVSIGKNGAEEPTSFDNPSLGTGGYAIDQAWHIGALALAALATALI